jgi:nucleoside phosphorylase
MKSSTWQSGVPFSTLLWVSDIPQNDAMTQHKDTQHNDTQHDAFN